MSHKSIKQSLILSLLIFSLKIIAVPASPYPVKIKQPDGSELTIRILGDEYFSYKTTIDGYALIADDAGFYNYAQMNSNGKFISTSVRATEIAKRSSTETIFLQTLKPNPDLSQLINIRNSLRAKRQISSKVPQKTYPLTGTPKSLVILVNFKDISFVTPNPQVAFTNLLNQSGYSTNGGTGCAKDYFHDSSNGTFNPQFDVVGPFTLPSNEAVYGANDASGNDIAPAQMVVDACTLAAASGVNFSQYDTDKNGIVDNVFIYYAGYNEAEGGASTTIWPHRWAVYPTGLYSNGNYNGSAASVTFNGVRVEDYACTSELRGNSGSNMCGVGTFCHEFGHVLGLDDLYNTNGDNSYITLETFDIMDYGPYLNLGRTPPAYSAYERFFLNWLIPTELKNATDIYLPSITSSNQAYLISQTGNHNLNGVNPNPVEFFLLENRQNSGWDTYFGRNPNPNISSQSAHGLYITHIFYNTNDWANNTPNNNKNGMGVDVVRADGIASAGTLAGDLFPGTSNVTRLTPLLRSGVDIKKPLINISETNGIIHFHFKTNVSITQNLQPFTTVQGTPSIRQSITVNGSKLKNPVTLSFKTGIHYEMKKNSDPETAWSKTLSLNPVDSVVTAIIQIRYNPTFPSFTNIHSDTFVASTIDGDYDDAAVSGTSTRAVYVVPPIASSATDITYTSFIANWNNVYDAVGYYATVYTAIDGKTTVSQGFDNGINAPKYWTITATGTSTSFFGSSAPSIQFQNSGEYVQTEKYLLPVTSLSFFIRSVAAINGGFLVQAQNSMNVWEKVDSIPVIVSLNEPNKSYTFAESKNYVRFKFTYIKGAGNITFDDVSVNLSKQVNYLQQDIWLTSNSDTLTNLIPGTKYYYEIKASDKNIPFYENITDFSNTVTVGTLAYEKAFFNKSNSQIIYKTSIGSIIIKVTSNKDIITIYNSLGQQVLVPLTPISNVIEISNLPRNQLYIVKVGNNIVKIVL